MTNNMNLGEGDTFILHNNWYKDQNHIPIIE